MSSRILVWQALRLNTISRRRKETDSPGRWWCRTKVDLTSLTSRYTINGIDYYKLYSLCIDISTIGYLYQKHQDMTQFRHYFLQYLSVLGQLFERTLLSLAHYCHGYARYAAAFYSGRL